MIAFDALQQLRKTASTTGVIVAQPAFFTAATELATLLELQ